MTNSVIKNASWIIGCKIVQALLSLVVTMLSARYLGPSGYGLINYAASIVAFAIPIMQLGLSSTLVQELIKHPESEGEILGTAEGLTLISGIASIIAIFSFVSVANHGEKVTIIVCTLYSTLLIFKGLDLVQLWFQSKLRSKYVALTALVSYVIVSGYKIFLLVKGSSIYWFAVSQGLDYAIIALFLHFIYKKQGGAPLKFSWTLGKEMFGRSHYYIISGLMVTVFAQTDRIMLKMMLDDAAVGYYSAAVTCAGMTSFVFSAIIDSARPSILEARAKSKDLFEDRTIILYSLIFYLALAQSVVITVLAKPIVSILYGDAYLPTVSALQIIVWYTTFSYLGGAKDIWILAEEKQRYLWIVNLSGAIANVILNAVLIPLWGINGAAVASLITQIFTNFGVGFILKPLRRNNLLMLKSVHPKKLISCVRDLQK